MAALSGLHRLRRRLRNELLDRPPSSLSTRGYLWATRAFGTTRVPLDHLLLGTEPSFLTGAQYARHTGDLLRPSRTLAQSVQVQLLQRYKEVGDSILDPAAFSETPYCRNALECIAVTGQYKDATSEPEVRAIARRFIVRYRDGADGRDTGSPPKVRAIRSSSYYEIVDGYHRLAITALRGETSCRVRVVRKRPEFTPLQELVLSTVQAKGKPELAQPIDAPELSEWVLTRRCHDRLAMIQCFLAEQGLTADESPTYLDIACGYGWFVNEFRKLGFQARGVDLDGVSVQIGRLWFGLEPNELHRGDAVAFLQRSEPPFDVTSCLGLLHHFVLGRGVISAEELLQLIDRATVRVFIFDMGQDHERWFADELAGWDPDRIESWVREHSSFTKIYRLGTDSDNTMPFADNYGRTLFACMR